MDEYLLKVIRLRAENEKLKERLQALLNFEQAIEEMMIPWLDVSEATKGMTPTERVLEAVRSLLTLYLECKENDDNAA